MTFKNKYWLTFIGLLCFSQPLLAEYKPSVSFELTKETYDVKADGTYVLTYESFTKIETEAGAKDDGEVDVSYNKTNERVEILEAYTLQPDGKKIPVPKSSIRDADDELASGAQMFYDLKHKIIIFPEVKVGSRLYHKYRLVAHKVPFQNHFIVNDFFTPHYAMNLYEVTLNASDKLKLNIDLKDSKGGLVGHSNGLNHYKFTHSHSTAHKAEPAQVQSSDFGSHILISTFNDQVEIGREYQKNLPEKVKVTPKVQKLANEITSGIKDEKGQIRAIYNWVIKNIRYVAVYVGNGGYIPHEADSIISNRFGDCKDHATLFEALLKAKGIESSAALINLGSAYKLPKFAVTSPINHVISYIPKYDLYLDTTSEFTRFGYLPFEDMDKPTILTALGKIGHTPKMTSEDYITETKVLLNIDPKGYISGTSVSHPKAVNEARFRSRRFTNRDRDDKLVMDSLLATYNETGTGVITSSNPLDLDSQFEVKSTFKLDPISNIPGPAAISIPVGAAPGAIYALGKNKPETKQDFPYVCYPEKAHEVYQIRFPDSVRVTRIPKDKSYAKDNITYHSTYKLEGQVVTSVRDFAIEHESLSCRPDQQDITEDFFKFIQQDLRSQIFYE